MIFEKRYTTFNPVFEVAGCLLEHDGKFLLLKRVMSKPEPGKFGLPAGKLKPLEDKWLGMTREVFEETSISLTDQSGKLHKSYFVQVNEVDLIFHLFHATLSKLPEIILNDNEHQYFIWVTPEESLYLDLVHDLDYCIKEFYKI